MKRMQALASKLRLLVMLTAATFVTGAFSYSHADAPRRALPASTHAETVDLTGGGGPQRNALVAAVAGAVVAAELAVFAAAWSALTDATKGPVIRAPSDDEGATGGTPDDCMACPYIPDPQDKDLVLDL